jgi:zinc transport system ATP-binding protein
MPDIPTSIITCNDAAFGYDGHIVVRELNFSIQAGDYVCIVGENGSGKSTLVKGLLRLLSPLQGTVTYGAGLARDAAKETSKLLRLHLPGRLDQKTIGYLSQQAAAKKDFPAGVLEIVLSGHLGNMGLRPWYGRKEKQAAEENLERLGIGDLKGRCYRELSGGQQRRVLLARALCAAHTLLILDEPAAGLDPLVTLELYALLKKINEEMGISIIMVSHDIGAAIKHSKQILHLQNAQQFFGTPDDYIQSAPGKEFSGGGKNE